MNENPNIITREVHAARKSQTPILRRVNYALGRGGAVDIYTYSDRSTAAVVPAPDALDAKCLAEIEANLKRETDKVRK